MSNIQKFKYIDEDFYKSIKNVIEESRKRVYTNIQSEMVFAYWQIGEKIVEKQKGETRAEYGTGLIKELSLELSNDYGKSFTERLLREIRQFYLIFPNRASVSAKLSWSHYRRLIRLNNAEARNFYIKECIERNWTVRQLEREIYNISYERYILSNKDYSLIQETADNAIKEEQEEGPETRLFVKEPLLLDFLGLKPGYKYYETELEQAILDHLSEFLLELGQGYTFVARQKRLDIDGDNFYIDLVLYNILERCYVLIDLKTGAATHRDIGQMQMYVNFYTENCVVEGDKPPIGMVLCADKNDKVIKYTLGPTNKQVKAYKYVTSLNEGKEIKEEAERYLNLLKKSE